MLSADETAELTTDPVATFCRNALVGRRAARTKDVDHRNVEG